MKRAILATLLATGCLEPLSIEAEAPHACLVVSGVPVLGVESPVPGLALLDPGAPGAWTFRQRFDLPVDQALLVALPESASLALTGLELSAQGGRLDFVERVEASVARSSDEAAPRTTLVRHRRAGPAPAVLSLEPLQVVDLVPFLRDGVLSLELALEGEPPPRSLLLEVTACFAARAEVSWRP